MSAAWFCGSLPARSLGYADGRGMADIVRRTAKLPAQACHHIRWNKYRDEPLRIDEVKFDLKGWLKVYESGRVERFKGTDFLPAFLDVACKDVLISTVTSVSVRMYLPNVVDMPSKKFPVLVYFHGGGFVIESTGSPNYHNYLTLLAAKAGVLIVSVNYRLAPEYPIPASYDDCMAALNWVVSYSSTKAALEPWLVKHGDFDKLLLSGDSAGANITHYVAMRWDHDKVKIKGIALVHPYFLGPERLKYQTKEDFKFHEDLWMLSAPNSKGLDDPLINPLAPGAPSLKGLNCKRVAVFVAEHDFLVERGRMYYEALLKSGWEGKRELKQHQGVGHVFHLNDFAGDISVQMMNDLLDFIKGCTNSPPKDDSGHRASETL